MKEIADLHCDLLCYLENDAKRTAFDREVRCSIPQLEEGGVKLQVMAAFTETAPGSSVKGLRQVEIFRKLQKEVKSIEMMLAIENASGLWGEEEELDFGRLGQPVYISLTWNGENRFGGGAHTRVGLKADGKALLDYMSGRGIALDLSHASDQLAEEALEYIEGLQIPVLASHSNFRAIRDVPRNLPDELAQEIFRRGGVVGINFVRDFVGEESDFVRHIEHGLKLGGALCLGADFYYGGDVSPAFRKPPEQMFFPKFSNSSCYPAFLELVGDREGIAHL